MRSSNIINVLKEIKLWVKQDSIYLAEIMLLRISLENTLWECDLDKIIYI